MEYQTWTTEAVEHARAVEVYYGMVTAFLSICTMPFVLFGFLFCYLWTRKKFFIFLLPFGPVMCFVMAYVAAEYMFWVGASINILGLHIGVSPVAPSSCAAATEIFGPGTDPCRLEELQEWVLLWVKDGKWCDIWTERAVQNIGLCSIFLLPSTFFGYMFAYGTNSQHWQSDCPECERVIESAEIEGGRPGSEKFRCKRCRDLELGVSGAALEKTPVV